MKKIQQPTVRIVHIRPSDIILTSGSSASAPASAGMMTEDNRYLNSDIW